MVHTGEERLPVGIPDHEVVEVKEEAACVLGHAPHLIRVGTRQFSRPAGIPLEPAQLRGVCSQHVLVGTPQEETRLGGSGTWVRTRQAYPRQRAAVKQRRG